MENSTQNTQEISENNKSTTKAKVKKGLNIASYVLVAVIFVFCILTITLMITAKQSGIPSLFGYTFLDIESPSMKGTLNKGDIAIVTKVDDISTLKACTDGDIANKDGDIITFWDTHIRDDGTPVLNTHMIVEIVYDDYNTKANIVGWRTQGTNNENVDTYMRVPNELVGKVVNRLAGFGYFTSFLQSWYGFLFVIILPLSAFLIYRIVILVKAIKEVRYEANVAKGNTVEALQAQLKALQEQIGVVGGSAGEDTEKQNTTSNIAVSASNADTAESTVRETATATAETTESTVSETVTAKTETAESTVSETATAKAETAESTVSETVTATAETAESTVSETVTAKAETAESAVSETATATAETAESTVNETETATTETAESAVNETVTATAETAESAVSETETATAETEITETAKPKSTTTAKAKTTTTAKPKTETTAKAKTTTAAKPKAATTAKAKTTTAAKPKTATTTKPKTTSKAKTDE